MRYMKKNCAAVFCLILLLNVLSCTAAARDYLTDGDFVYTVSGDQATLMRYDGTDTDVTVPPTLGGCSVTEIGMYAFSEREVERVMLSEGVLRIGLNAFGNAESLREVILPDTLERLDGDVFRNCRSLERVVLPNGLAEIGTSAFWGCASLREITLPDTLTVLGTAAFYGCESLERVHLPDSLDTLPMSCFAECVSLRDVHLPQTLTALPQMCFGNCVSLAEVVLPQSLEQIWNNAFYGCKGLESLTVPASVTAIDGGFLAGCGEVDLRLQEGNEVFCIKNNCLYEGTRLVQALYGAQVPTEGVTEIGAYAFRGADWLTEAVIPDSVTSLAHGAFSECVSLRTASVPATVDAVPIDAFFGCVSLETVHLAEGLTRICGRAFEGCTALKRITLPNSIEVLESRTFAQSGLERIFIPYWASYVYDGLFEGCENLAMIECETDKAPETWAVNWNASGVETVFGATRDYAHGPAARFENGFGYRVQNGRAVLMRYDGTDETLIFPAALGGLPVTEIPDHFLLGNKTLRHLTVSEGIQTVGMMAFGDCEKLETVVLPESLTALGSIAFSGCTALREIALPDGLTQIGNGLFSGCTSLTELVLPRGTEAIPDSMFAFCGLTEVVIPEGVTELGDGVFSGCQNLRTVHLPASLLVLGDRVFADCPQLERVTVSETNTVFCTKEDALLSGDVLLLFWGEGELPAGIKTIGKSACSARAITSLVIPDGVERIEQEAFYYCDRLASVTFPDSLKTIEAGAFAECCSIQKIILPEGLESIGSMAFAWCDALCEVYIPESVAAVEENAFFYCESLSSVSCGAEERPDGWSLYMFHFCGEFGYGDVAWGISHPDAKAPSVSDEPIAPSESVQTDVSEEEPRDGASPVVWIVLGIIVLIGALVGARIALPYLKKRKSEQTDD